MVAPISGGHLNPAVTLSLAISNQISILRSALYVVAQCGGASLAAICAKGVSYRESNFIFSAANGISSTFSLSGALLAEIVGTFILCYTVLVTAVDGGIAPGLAPLYIGLSVFVLHLVGIPIDGTSINPARSFGAALISGLWENFWVFVVGPFSAALLAAVFWRVMKDAALKIKKE